jgi:hypothetical protein
MARPKGTPYRNGIDTKRPMSTLYTAEKYIPPLARMHLLGEDRSHQFWEDGQGDVYLASKLDGEVTYGFRLEFLPNFRLILTKHGEMILAHLQEAKDGFVSNQGG